jgi:hypothetical protein
VIILSIALKNLSPADEENRKVSLKMSEADDQFTKDQENKRYEFTYNQQEILTTYLALGGLKISQGHSDLFSLRKNPNSTSLWVSSCSIK